MSDEYTPSMATIRHALVQIETTNGPAFDRALAQRDQEAEARGAERERVAILVWLERTPITTITQTGRFWGEHIHDDYNATAKLAHAIRAGKHHEGES